MTTDDIVLGPRSGPLVGTTDDPTVQVLATEAIGWLYRRPGPELSGTLTVPVSSLRWLVVIEDSEISLPDDATDVSHGIVRLRISRPDAATLLATGVSIDLDPDVFVEGDAAATAYREIFVVIHRTGPHGFDVYSARSTARSLGEWLVDAAAGLDGLDSQPGGGACRV